MKRLERRRKGGRECLLLAAEIEGCNVVNAEQAKSPQEGLTFGLVDEAKCLDGSRCCIAAEGAAHGIDWMAIPL